MPVVFNPPPGWPAPPAGWAPPSGWLPDSSWPPAPPQWQFWAEVPDVPGALPESAWAPQPTTARDGDAAYGSAAPPRPPWLSGSRSTPAVAAATATGAASALPAPARSEPSRARLAAGLGWGGVAVSALLGLISGVGGALLFAGLFAFVVAIVALVRGRVRWAHLPTRAAGALALAGAVVAVAVGGAVSPPVVPTSAPAAPQAFAPSPAATSPAATPAPPAPTSSTTSASPAPVVDPVVDAITKAPPGTALALVGTLSVKGRGPLTGYARAAFGAAWTDTDRNGCDQRNDTLRRDLTSVTLKAGTHGCTVMTGRLTDPYTGTAITFARTSSPASPVQIDHVVPLVDAWVTGAAGWPQTERTSFANDTLNLIAVSAKVNESKGGGDAATWLPPVKAYRCTYVARQVAVKAKYQLAVTAAERSAIVGVLTTCASTKVPAVAVAKLGGFPLHVPSAPKPVATPSTHPAPQPAPTPVSKPAAPAPRPSVQPAAPAPVQGVHPGAFCSPQGARGYTSKGTLMQCSLKAGDIRARWRSA